jgi:hypothetical protein
MLSILKNQEIIAINQDSIYGTSISPFRWGINVRYCLLGIFHHTYRWLNSLTGPMMQHTLLNTGAVPVRTEQTSIINTKTTKTKSGEDIETGDEKVIKVIVTAISQCLSSSL